MTDDTEISRVLAVKAKYEQQLLRNKNVVGLGVGFREKDGKLTDQMVLTVMVREKQPLTRLHPREVIPSELDGVPVDVKEVGDLRAL